MILLDFLQNLANLILGLLFLRWGQTQLVQRNPDSEFTKALGFLLH